MGKKRKNKATRQLKALANEQRSAANWSKRSAIRQSAAEKAEKTIASLKSRVEDNGATATIEAATRIPGNILSQIANQIIQPTNDQINKIGNALERHFD